MSGINDTAIEARFLVRRDAFTLDVDLQLPARGLTGIYGPSGCGKTTLLRAIAGLERPQEGFLRIGAKLWQSHDVFVPTHQRSLGYVFQEPSLFPHLDVGKNLEYGLRRSKGSKAALTQAVALLGIGHLLDRRVHELSGGEQQRVGIARALAMKPSILLLDEPLSALDQARKQEFLPYLEQLHQQLDIPVLYVSHSRQEIARLADHMVLMEAGSVRATDKVNAIFSQLDLPLANEADAETVVEGTISEAQVGYGLVRVSSAAGDITAPGPTLPAKTSVRIQILARDVSITLNRQTETSILNILPATIEALADQEPSQVTVQLRVGEALILSRITRKSASDLDLKPGKPVYAQIKSVALLT